MGPQGPAGLGAGYVAGWVNANVTVKYGVGFSVVRLGGVTGTYRINVAAATLPSGRFLVTTVSPVSGSTFARVVRYFKNGDGSHSIDVEIYTLAGALVDSDFNFIAVDRS